MIRVDSVCQTHLQQFDLPSDWSAIAIGAAAAAWHYIFGEDQPAVVTRTVGGNATPVARRARLAAGLGAERTTKRLPSCAARRRRRTFYHPQSCRDRSRSDRR